ncbi:hypothetical protein DPMN_160044 [Dreissena polymorpha]|uniref:Uncharacterized protein n=1 Tax=Dreissena polymorpha TaxID=45954 RepID=A0A9D4IS76_DREPO|nr:hypothetical protein DPMN_160044 [Dreissena polymorpha]
MDTTDSDRPGGVVGFSAFLSVDGLVKTSTQLHHGINADQQGQARQQNGINTVP